MRKNDARSNWSCRGVQTGRCGAAFAQTRSGKILRATMVKIADSQDFKMPATIDDPAILDEIKEALQTLGYAK